MAWVACVTWLQVFYLHHLIYPLQQTTKGSVFLICPFMGGGAKTEQVSIRLLSSQTWHGQDEELHSESKLRRVYSHPAGALFILPHLSSVIRKIFLHLMVKSSASLWPIFHNEAKRITWNRKYLLQGNRVCESLFIVVMLHLRKRLKGM